MYTVNEDLLNSLIGKLDVIFEYVQFHSGGASCAGSVPAWYTSKEVCDMLNIHKRTLQRLRHDKRITYSRIGRRIIYKHNDVDFLVSQRAVNCDTRHFIKTLYQNKDE